MTKKTFIQKWEDTKLYKLLDTMDTYCAWHFVNPLRKLSIYLLAMLLLIPCIPILPFFLAKHNGCINFNSGRDLKFIFSTIFKGWNISETWSLDQQFVEWFLPRLKFYNDKATNIFIMKPSRVKELYELQDIVERMVKDDYEALLGKPYEEWPEAKDIKRFQKLLPKHLVGMWW